VEERKKRWVKFGDCKDSVGPEPGMTETEPPIEFVLGSENKRKFNLLPEKEQEEMEELHKTLIKTSTVWRPNPRVRQTTLQGIQNRREQNQRPINKDKYVPPSLRNRGQGGVEPVCAIRVTNLPEDTTKDDLYGLFERFGPIVKIFLEKEQNTNQAKGFAFIHFENRENAEAAINKLLKDKVGLKNLILNVEWAKPSSRSSNF